MFLADRKAAISQAKALVAMQPIYLDTETTGISPQAEIIEVAVVDHDGILLFESLVKPLGQMEPDALKVHRITPEKLVQAPKWPEVWSELQHFLTEKAICTYNSEFDLRILKQTHQKHWLKWDLAEENFHCIMKLYARFKGEWDSKRGSYRWQSLDQAGRDCRIPIPNIHRAREDTLLARSVLMYMANQPG